MARPIVLSNGELHVGLNNRGMVHDFYFPYVGLENHAAGDGLQHKVGIWVDGHVSWLDNGEWEFRFRYETPALLGHTTATHQRLGLIVEFDDCVDTEMSLFMRNIHVVNLRDEVRDVKLYIYQAFAIGDSRSNTDTAQYLPDSDAILHYRGRRAFVISGTTDEVAFDQYTIGLFGIDGHEGSYRDADDGQLSGNNVEHGRVDSILGFSLTLQPRSSSRVHYWIAAGMSMREALYIHKQVQTSGIDARLHATGTWWHNWVQPALTIIDKVPAGHRELFIQSLIVLKSQIDKRGAVIASTDSSLLNYSRDAYGYCWPRDGAYVVWPLIRLGYIDEPRHFFEFCLRGLHTSGYLMHKYRANGAIGSSWHPYVHGDQAGPPIQEDETALVVYVFAEFYFKHKDKALLKHFYSQMIVPMADFMAEYIDEETKLPLPSYDLWEEVYETTTYTTAVTYAGLMAASRLAEAMNDNHSAVKWQTAAESIQQASKKLYNNDRKVFNKALGNEAIDSSAVFGAYAFGLFDTASEEVVSSMATLQSTFEVSEHQPGVPRYENDYYRRTADVTGNYWPIASLWLAQYSLESGDTCLTYTILDWVKEHALSTGMIGEQLNPVDSSVVSPAPLTWSQAEYLSTILDLINTEHAHEA